MGGLYRAAARKNEPGGPNGPPGRVPQSEADHVPFFGASSVFFGSGAAGAGMFIAGGAAMAGAPVAGRAHPASGMAGATIPPLQLQPLQLYPPPWQLDPWQPLPPWQECLPPPMNPPRNPPPPQHPCLCLPRNPPPWQLDPWQLDPEQLYPPPLQLYTTVPEHPPSQPMDFLPNDAASPDDATAIIMTMLYIAMSPPDE
jgi:hypothetical protein